MGYRHVFITSYIGIGKEIPDWFEKKYKDLIDWSKHNWTSYVECKRYGAYDEIEKDIQKLMIF